MTFDDRAVSATHTILVATNPAVSRSMTGEEFSIDDVLLCLNQSSRHLSVLGFDELDRL